MSRQNEEQWIDTQVDLTNCDREPIHLLGHVQDYGCLIAVSSDWIVRHASRNVDVLLGIEAESAIGVPLSQLMSPGAVQTLRDAMAGLGRDMAQSRLFGVELDGRRLDVSIHQSDRNTVLEFEQFAGRSDQSELGLVDPLIKRVQRLDDAQAAVEEAARSMRALTGFDRVMVYRFDEDQSGTVIAESRSGGNVDSFLGLRYPASDIPKQARELYKRSLLRLIESVDGPAHEIIPAASPEGKPLDLSLAVTRAVSPIHLEYLRNMGVVSSMSVSIIRDGELWGLFACHSSRPMRLSFSRRTAVELFAQLLSYELDRKQAAEERAQTIEARKLHDALIGRVSRDGDFIGSIELIQAEVGAVINHDGIAIFHEGEYECYGYAPTRDEFTGLARYLNTTEASQVFATHRLQSGFPAAAEFADPPAGLLALPISRTPRDYIVLFRREVARMVTWAGNPNKPVELGPNGARLTPRKSFEAWKETVKGTSARWTETELDAAEALRVTLLEVVLRMSDEAAQMRRAAAEKQELLVAELNHRVRNILNLIRGLASRSRDGAATIEEYTRDLDGRINALARAHDQLTRAEWEASSLTDLILLEAEAYGGGGGRLSVRGEDVSLAPEAFSTLALVMHEMVTNSAKYGALSSPEGSVDVALVHRDGGGIDIAWRESGGPPVSPPTRRGFGSTIISRSIPHELSGTTDLRYAEGGLEADFFLPGAHLSVASERKQERLAKPSLSDTPSTVGATRPVERALVVEDNLIIALDTADMLSELGAGEVVTASSVSEAMQALDEGRFDLALLDVNLGSETSIVVAQRLADEGVPFALTTGYGEEGGVISRYPPASVLRKPFTSADLRNLLASLMA
ncbi:HWE histidine kinase domain-containing protein [Jannaschia aquimarina]|uniref:histidine kinase n=1 Tax=Jannaschia aquimarina TaxID=935700 RepID=A0A0D1EPE1_9RHOB|nr:HWE histidine kinase domain-containing protein [Jannaschia aquimarina]KIT17535.1 Bacteriophytochrome [Jannaschia aquimarina]SNS73489.1 Bacteriophytochrome (light-regulated signal transduction histidine kinase) [Jannaschia aquimarina]